MIGITLFVSDLGWGGYTVGAFRWYHVLEEGMSPYYTLDTVVDVSAWDGSGSRCSLSSADRATYILYANSYDPQVDTAFAYYDGTYLVDLIDNGLISLPGLTGIRVLKFPLTVGDSWQATDTCIYPLNTAVSMGYDEDWDGIDDSLYFSPSYATLSHLSGDTAEIFISPYVATFVYTGTSPDTGSTFICCRNLSAHFYLHLKYVNSVGMTYYSIDSLLFYETYAIVDTSTTPWDTTYVPPTLTDRMYDYLSWTYTTTQVSERRASRTIDTYEIQRDRIKALRSLTLYSTDGRLVARLQKGQSVRLKRGLYFVKTAKGTVKVLVR